MAVSNTRIHTYGAFIHCIRNAKRASLAFCSIEIPFSGREVILLQEVTPREGQFFQEVPQRDRVVIVLECPWGAYHPCPHGPTQHRK